MGIDRLQQDADGWMCRWEEVEEGIDSESWRRAGPKGASGWGRLLARQANAQASRPKNSLSLASTPASISIV